MKPDEQIEAAMEKLLDDLCEVQTVDQLVVAVRTGARLIRDARRAEETERERAKTARRTAEQLGRRRDR